jgi:23S rRNA (guanosine2251-2'-O)-methyltransferase
VHAKRRGQTVRPEPGRDDARRSVSESAQQSDPGSAYMVGRRAAIEALRDDEVRAGIEKVYLAHGVHGPQIAEILGTARKFKLAVGELDRQKFAELERRASQGVPTQGVIILLAQRGYQELEDVIPHDRAALLIALDGVEDPHNIGAIIRSAEAAGSSGILLPRRGAVLTPTIYKTSAGAANHFPIVKIGNLEQTIRKLQEDYGVTCVGLAGEATETIYEADLTGPVCFVTGSEEKGMHRLVRERCEKLVKIPLAGKTASLNASVASAVALFEAIRQRSIQR